MYCNNPTTYLIKEKDNLYLIAKYYNTTVPMILSLNNNLDPYNLKVGSTIKICPGDSFHPQSNKPNIDSTYKQNAFTEKMRLLWSQHVYWTRMVLISIAERLKDLAPTEKRLLQNPYDIANIFKNYYPEQVAQIIAQLLTEHLQIGAQLITALRDKQNSLAASLTQQWYVNADKMADAFSSINPYYEREALRKMLYRHLELTTQEVAMRLAGNYSADIQAFDKVEDEAMMMADYFSSGIIQQSPQKFF